MLSLNKTYIRFSFTYFDKKYNNLNKLVRCMSDYFYHLM